MLVLPYGNVFRHKAGNVRLVQFYALLPADIESLPILGKIG